MSALNLIYPMFAMVLLTAVVLGVSFQRRVRAVREGGVSVKYFRIYQGEVEPESSAQAARHFTNLFEAPVLFYVACVSAMVVGLSGALIVSLAWLYVLARVAHAYVHLGRNRLRARMTVYFFSWLVLLGLWVDIVITVARQA